MCFIFRFFAGVRQTKKNIPISNNYQLATRVSPEAILSCFIFYLKRILNCIEAEMCRWYSIYLEKKKEAFVTLIKVGSTAASSGVHHLLLRTCMYIHRISAEGTCCVNVTICMKWFEILTYHIVLSCCCSRKILVAFLQMPSLLRVALSCGRIYSSNFLRKLAATVLRVAQMNFFFLFQGPPPVDAA